MIRFDVESLNQSVRGLEVSHAEVLGNQQLVFQSRAQDRSILDKTKGSLANLIESYGATFPVVKAKLAGLEAKVGSIAAGTNFGNPSVVAPQGIARLVDLDALQDQLEDQIHPLKDECQKLRDEVEFLSGQQASGNPRVVNGILRGGPSTSPSNLEGRLDSNTGAIEELKSRVEDLITHKDERGYVTFDYQFRSLADVVKWVELNKIETCGHFWDMFSVLAKMGGKNQTGMQQAQLTLAALKIKTTPLEMDLLTAMEFKRPWSIFVLNSPEIDTMVCESYSKWIGSGLFQPVVGSHQSALSSWVLSVRGRLRNQAGSVGSALAAHLLNQVETQFSSLKVFIDTFYKELTTIAKFPEASAWKLIGRCLGCFFQSMVEVRAEMSAASEYQTVDFHSQMIWTVLRCHTLVEDFVAFNFRGHPSMVREMTIYMMTERVDPCELLDMKAAILGAEKATALVTKMAGDYESTKRQLGVR